MKLKPHEWDSHVRSGRRGGRRGGHQACPPHGPHVVDPVGEAAHAARCLACGLRGPERADVGEAKLAFDEAVAAKTG